MLRPLFVAIFREVFPKATLQRQLKMYKYKILSLKYEIHKYDKKENGYKMEIKLFVPNLSEEEGSKCCVW
jgi:hypothetical protein